MQNVFFFDNNLPTRLILRLNSPHGRFHWFHNVGDSVGSRIYLANQHVGVGCVVLTVDLTVKVDVALYTVSCGVFKFFVLKLSFALKKCIILFA
jgi:hypothetical protein